MFETLRAKLKGWRTVIWHSLVAGSGAIIATLDQLKQIDWSQYFTATRVAFIGVGLGIAGIWLRLVTSTAVGKKDE